MKTRLLLIGIIAIITVMITSIPNILAEPQSYEDFMKTYQPILDRVYHEKLSPHKQIDIGLLMRDVVCFNNGVQVLQLSSQSYVACVNPATAPILVQRGWGAVMYDETKNFNNHSSECSIVWHVHYDDITPKSSELIYKLRYTLNTIQEYLMWYPVIVDDNHRFTITMLSVGSYSMNETKIIEDSLNSVSGVESVEAVPGGCV